MPKEGSTEAIAALPLLHWPPETVLVSRMVELTQTAVAPLIVPAFNPGFTETLACAVAIPQPAEVTVYTMLAVPCPTAVTTPVIEFTIATAVLLLLQVPAGVPLLVN